MVTRAWLAAALCAGLASGAPPKTLSELLAQSPAQDWRSLDPENTLYMEIPQGRVVIELASHFAPQSAANIRTLAKAGYFDGLAIVRAQDNYVVQWGDPDEKNPRSLGAAKANKGVFVTTSYFTKPAIEFAEKHPFKMVLIDGGQLTSLMIRYNVGVRSVETLHIKKIDEDFFPED